jgi:hypothetical protein
MNPIRHIRRMASVLAGLACTWLGLAVAAPAAFATRVPPPGGTAGHITPPPGPVYKVPVHTVVTGGMPGWQIALIAAGAALAAAAIAVMLDRARTARRRVTRVAT